MTKIDFWRDFSTDCSGLASSYLEAGEQLNLDIRAELQEVVAQVLKPRPRMRVDQCSDKYRWIPQSASSNFGKFQTSTYEVARGPMMAVTEPGVRIITVAAATQLMKTTMLESTALYFMLIEPAAMIMVEPNKEAAEDLAKNKIGAMIEYTPKLKEVMLKSTLLRKAFMGGDLKITNAGSETNLAMNMRRVSMCDEFEKYIPLPGGSAVKLVEERTTTHEDEALNIRVCSPREEEGPTWLSFLEGDQRLPFVECPNCGHDHFMRFRNDAAAPGERKFNLVWDDDKTGKALVETARYQCPACDHDWTHGERLVALSKLRWKQTKPFTCCADHDEGGHQRPEETRRWIDLFDPDDGQHIVSYAVCKVCGERGVSNRHASFNANRFYSPKKLDQMLAVWLDAQGTQEALKNFVNSHLAEPWKELSQIDVSADGLLSRAERGLAKGIVPDRAAVGTCGVDTQDDRLEGEIVWWGRGMESWHVDYFVIDGDTTDPRTWAKLDKILFKDYVGKDGRKFRIEATCIDSGGHSTSQVYRYCKARAQFNVFATKGYNETGRNHKPIWPANPSYVGHLKTTLRMLGTIAAKAEFYSYLMRKDPGPGYVHLPIGVEHSYAAGLLSERKVKVPGGFTFKPKSGVRNEPLDCRVLNIAAAYGLCQIWNDPLWIDHECDRLGIGKTLTPDEQAWFDKRRRAQIEEQTQQAFLKQLGNRKPKKPVEQSFASRGDEQLQSDLPEPEPMVAAASLPARRAFPTARRSGTRSGGTPPGWR